MPLEGLILNRLSADLELRLLGGLSLVTVDGGHIALTRKHKLLVAALVLAGSRGLSRENLINLLWKDLGENQPGPRCAKPWRRPARIWAHTGIACKVTAN